MVANLTTPLLGIVATIAIGRLGDATLLGGVAMASVIFDCLFWLFAFLRMSTVAFTAQALGAAEATSCARCWCAALCRRGDRRRPDCAANAAGGRAVRCDGRQRGRHPGRKDLFRDPIWSAPLVLANYVVLGWLIGQARAALALSVQIAINLINMAATVLLVLVLDLGIAGAAMAAIIAEAQASWPGF